MTTAYGSLASIAGPLLGDADSFKKVIIAGLTPHKTYHYRVRAINAVDTSYGIDMTFISGGASSHYSSHSYNTIVLDSNGIVYTMGDNTFGQLGDGTTMDRKFLLEF